MIDALSPLYSGPLAAYRDLITSRARVQADAAQSLDGVISAREVLSPGWLSACIAVHGLQYQDQQSEEGLRHPAPASPDERALLSQWSKYLLSSMVSLPLAANLLLDHQLPLELRHLSLRLGDNGVVTQLVLDDAAGQGDSLTPGIMAAGGDEVAMLDARFGHYLAQLDAVIARLVPHTSLGAKVFWSNAAHYFVYIVGMMEEQGWAQQAAPARQLMATRVLTNGRRNPLYQPISTVMDRHGERHTPRKVCCVRYRIECLGYCDNCPLSIERPVAKRTKPLSATRAKLIYSDLSES
jgi:ferric iron reductase protein FhuF